VSPSKKANGLKVEGKQAGKLKVEGSKKKVKAVTKKKRVAASKSQPENLTPAQPIPEPKPETSLWTNILRVLAVLAVIGITVYIYSIRSHVQEFAAYGYPGIFVVTLLANATVFLPAPGVAVVFAMGSILNPLGIAFAAGTGGALGELSGFLAAPLLSRRRGT